LAKGGTAVVSLAKYSFVFTRWQQDTDGLKQFAIASWFLLLCRIDFS